METKIPSVLIPYRPDPPGAGTLLHMLSNPERHDVMFHVHQTLLFTNSERADVETTAATAVLERIVSATDREIVRSDNVMDYRPFATQPHWDLYSIYFVAANICRMNREIRDVAIGLSRTDFELGGSEFTKHVSRAEDIFHAVLGLPRGAHSAPTTIYPVRDQSTAELWEAMPEDLREATWPCHRTDYSAQAPAPCGACFGCRSVQSSGVRHPAFFPESRRA